MSPATIRPATTSRAHAVVGSGFRDGAEVGICGPGSFLFMLLHLQSLPAANRRKAKLDFNGSDRIGGLTHDWPAQIDLRHVGALGAEDRPALGHIPRRSFKLDAKADETSDHVAVFDGERLCAGQLADDDAPLLMSSGSVARVGVAQGPVRLRWRAGPA